jgi:hypothetical protein
MLPPVLLLDNKPRTSPVATTGITPFNRSRPALDRHLKLELLPASNPAIRGRL